MAKMKKKREVEEEEEVELAIVTNKIQSTKKSKENKVEEDEVKITEKMKIITMTKIMIMQNKKIITSKIISLKEAEGVEDLAIIRRKMIITIMANNIRTMKIKIIIKDKELRVDIEKTTAIKESISIITMKDKETIKTKVKNNIKSQNNLKEKVVTGLKLLEATLRGKTKKLLMQHLVQKYNNSKKSCSSSTLKRHLVHRAVETETKNLKTLLHSLKTIIDEITVFDKCRFSNWRTYYLL
jgi:hypothetical protein